MKVIDNILDVKINGSASFISNSIQRFQNLDKVFVSGDSHQLGADPFFSKNWII